MRRCPNIDKYLKEFKQKPSVGIDKGLQNFYQYAKKIGYRVLVIGGGRWGQITYNNLSSLASISELNLISRTLNINNSILNNKNIK